MKDLWTECYSPELQKIGTEKEFTHSFCRICNNTACVRSTGNKTKWNARMLRQGLLATSDPVLADMSDPAFAQIRSVDFPSMFEQAVLFEIADRNQDWEIPTQVDKQKFAEEIIQRAMQVPPVPQSASVARTVLRSEKVQGSSSGEVYEVQYVQPEQDGSDASDPRPVWECDCKAFVFGRANPCKHIIEVQMQRNTVEAAPNVQETPMPPVRIPVGTVLPRLNNIPLPMGGIMLDGTSPVSPPQIRPEPEIDPWAVPVVSKKDTIVPVGGRVVMSGRSEEKK